MTSIVLNFEIHQPIRLDWMRDEHKISNNGDFFKRYFDMGLNEKIFRRVAKKCYYPTNDAMLETIDGMKKIGKDFKLSYSLSGTFIEQAKMWEPGLLDSFKRLAETGNVEFLDETYYHSLSSLFGENKDEFVAQLRIHRKAMKELFGQEPKVMRNTEFLYNNLIARTAERAGYRGIYTEGIEWILRGWRSPNFLYRPIGTKNISLLLRNYRLSDDIGYRFSAHDWNEWPLTADKYASWLASTPGDLINICMDYETFGEHQWQESGIFWFLKSLPYQIANHDNLEFATPSEVIEKHKPKGEIDVFDFSTISWADMERDVSAWLGNKMQQKAFEQVRKLEKSVLKTQNPELLHIWRLLQTSDHYYYLCMKWWGDGDVHHYFSHMKNPHEAYANFMNIIYDFKDHVNEYLKKNNIKA